MRTWKLRNRYVHEIPCEDLAVVGSPFLDEGIAEAISNQQARVYQVDGIRRGAKYIPGAPLYIVVRGKAA